MPWAIYFKTIPYKQQFLVEQSSTETNVSESSVSLEAAAQQLVRQQTDNELNGQMNNQFVFNSDSIDNQFKSQSNSEISDRKQTTESSNHQIHSSIDEYCESKKDAELRILTAIHRLILKMKIYFLHRSVHFDSEHVNFVKFDTNETIFIEDEKLRLPVDYFEHSLLTYSAASSFLQKFNQLDQLIKQLNTFTCKCIDRMDLFFRGSNNQTAIDRQLSIQRSISVYLDFLFDILPDEDATTRRDRTRAQSEVDNQSDRQVKQLNANLISRTALAEDRKQSLNKLNYLETNLYSQIKSRDFVLLNADCTLGCDNLLLDNSMCTLLYLFTNQTEANRTDLSRQSRLEDERLDVSLDNRLDNSVDNSVDNSLDNSVDNSLDNRVNNRLNIQLDNQSSKSRQVRSMDNERVNESSSSKDDFEFSHDFDYETCNEQWPNQTLERTYFIVANLILCYLLPLVIISACYIAIWMTVWNRSVPCETTTSDTAINTPTLELPEHHSCRVHYARKQTDQQSTASSSRSTKSLFINTFTGLKNMKQNLFPATAHPKHSSVDNVHQKCIGKGRLNGRPSSNQSLIIKFSKNSQTDCDLCGERLDQTCLPKTNEDYEIVNDELIKDRLMNDQSCCNSINRLNSPTDRQTTKSNEVRKSLIVCNYDRGNRSNQMTNAKQQIMITIDRNSSTNSTKNSSSMHESTSSRLYRRLQGKFRFLRKLLPSRKATIEYNVNMEGSSGNTLVRSTSLKANHRLGSNQPNMETFNEFKQLMQSDQANDLDYEIEQIDELEHNFKQQKNFTNREQSKRNLKSEVLTTKCAHCNQLNKNDQINRLMVKRALSKQSIIACARCSNINNNCECKSHHQKQLITSTKSTPITGNDRRDRISVLERNRKPSAKRRSRQLKLAQQLDKSNAKLNNRIEVLIKNSRYKVAKMMIVIIFVFFLCWLPLYIIFTKLKLGLQFTRFTQLEEKITFLLTPFAQWISYINSCINPILYAFLNKKYRAEFKKLFSNVRCFRFMKRAPTSNPKNLKHNSFAVLKASVKSHPSISANYEKNIPDRTNERNCSDRTLAREKQYSFNEKIYTNVERKQDDENRKKTIPELGESPNDLTKEQESTKKGQHTTPAITRSSSDINLKNRCTVKRSSFSGSIS